MRNFTLKEFTEYIPKCVICEKDMYLFVKGNLQSQKHVFTGKKISIKTKIENGHIIAESKDYPFDIRADDNEIMVGQEFFTTLFKNWVYINKRCRTCDFIVGGMILSHDYPDFKSRSFPNIKLSKEKLAYTMPGGKNVIIDKKYYDPATFLSNRTTIEINKKMLPPFPFDFTAIVNLKQLNTRLLTIRTFQ